LKKKHDPTRGLLQVSHLIGNLLACLFFSHWLEEIAKISGEILKLGKLGHRWKLAADFPFLVVPDFT
jgi:hypothetical protein